MKTLACLVLLLRRTNYDRKAILADFAHQTRIQALKMALIGAILIVLAGGSGTAASITVHAPDGEGRVFVDVVGKIDDGDFEAFKEKTDQIGVSDPKKLVIVTLMSYGGAIGPAMQIGEWVRKRGMLTFVPGDRTCASACALIWVAGSLRTVGHTPQIGFHAAYDEDTGRESGAGNAVMGAYLRDLGFGYQAIHFMTHKGPTSVEWLTPDLAKEKGVAWFMLQSPRAIPIPSQQPGLHPPQEVIAAWSKLVPRPVTAPPERSNETIVVKRPRQWKWVDEDARPKEVREPAQSPAPVTTSPEPVPSTGALPTPWPTIHYRIARCIPKGARRVLADRDSSEVPNALSYAAQPTSIATTRSVPLAFGVPRPTPAPAPTSAPHGHPYRGSW
jgi:hypothetical protein